MLHTYIVCPSGLFHGLASLCPLDSFLDPYSNGLNVPVCLSAAMYLPIHLVLCPSTYVSLSRPFISCLPTCERGAAGRGERADP